MSGAENLAFYPYLLCQTGLIFYSFFQLNTFALQSFGAHASVRSWFFHFVKFPFPVTIFALVVEITVPEGLCFNIGCFWRI